MTIANVPSANVAERLWSAEQSIKELLAARGGLRFAHLAHLRNVRICKTVDDGTGYPPPPANTFAIKFLDSYFDPTPGQRMPIHAERADPGATHDAIAHNIPDKYLGEGTICIALWQRGLPENPQGEWWLERIDKNFDLALVKFRLDDPLPLGGTANATVQACSGEPPSGSIVVEDPYTAPGMFCGPAGYEGIAYWWPTDTNCNYQIIYMEHQARKVWGPLLAPFSGGSTTMTVSGYAEGKSPGGSVTIEDRCGLYAHLLPGDCVVGTFDEKTKTYFVDDGRQGSVRGQALCLPINGQLNIGAGYTNVIAVPIMTILSVNEDAYLRLFVDNANVNHGIISIDPSPDTGNVWKSNGIDIHWSRSLELGHHLEIGSALATGEHADLILTAPPEVGGSYIVSGDSPSTMYELTPDDVPTLAGQAFAVGAVNGTVFKMKTAGRGHGEWSGQIVACAAPGGGEVRFTIEAGRILKVTDENLVELIDYPTDQGDADHTAAVTSDADPCPTRP